MRNYNLIFAILFLSVLFSCKKDFDINEALINEPYVQHFYANGNLFDHKNDTATNFSIDNFEYDVEGTTEVIYTGSVSTEGALNGSGNKYILSATGTDPGAVRMHSEGPNAVNYYLNALRNFIAVKMVSDRPGSEADRKFSRTELLEMLEVGRPYTYGDGPFQVEVGFHHPPIDSLPDYVFFGYIGSTKEVPNEESVFEILEIEDFVEVGVQEPVTGLKVRARITADVQYAGFPAISLRDVEATFLFEYE
ncbi:MAG: hypothetical protein AAFZ15_03015 [Bacteroidota bacterium]